MCYHTRGKMLSLTGCIFVEHRKRVFLPWSNSLIQLVVQHLKANMWPFIHGKDGDLDCKMAMGLQSSVKSRKENNLKTDFFIVFCPFLSLRAATARMCLWARECTLAETKANFLFFSTNFNMRELNDSTECLYTCHFTAILIDCLLHAVVIYNVLKTESETHQLYQNCRYHYIFCFIERKIPGKPFEFAN